MGIDAPCCRAAAAAALVAALGGCAIDPALRGPIEAREVVVRVGDGRPDALVIPGVPTPLHVYVKDLSGNVFSTSRGSLGRDRFSVATRNMTYDAETQTVTPALLGGAALAGADYAAIVTAYGRRVEVILRPDVDAVLGPPPARVKTMVISFGGEAKPEFVRPGHPLKLAISVVDDKDQRWELGGKPGAALPSDRLLVEPVEMTWDPAVNALVGEADRRRLGARRYAVRIEYRALPGEAPGDQARLVLERSFTPDFVAIDGPDPASAKELRIELQAPSAVTPGTELPVVISVRDSNGRWLTVRGPGTPLGIPPERFDVRARRARFDAARQVLVLDPASHDLVGDSFQIQVSYVGNRKLAASRKLAPDFLAAVAPFLTAGDDLALGGAEGEDGASGASGVPGSSGSDGSPPYGTGTAAANGGPGDEGEDGSRGGDGPTVTVAATEATTLDGKVRLVVVVTETGGVRDVLVRRLDGPKLTILSSGGRGGSGGKGGSGGAGGRGGNGWSTGDGGDGGSGSDGGNGGPGGTGGTLRGVASSAAVREHLVLRAPGGAGGAGGGAGAAGEAGSSGNNAVAGAAAFADVLGQVAAGNASASAPQAVHGADGKAGRSGNRGRSGPGGAAGTLELRVDPSARSIEAALPENLRAVLKFAPVGGP